MSRGKYLSLEEARQKNKQGAVLVFALMALVYLMPSSRGRNIVRGPVVLKKELR